MIDVHQHRQTPFSWVCRCAVIVLVAFLEIFLTACRTNPPARRTDVPAAAERQSFWTFDTGG